MEMISEITAAAAAVREDTRTCWDDTPLWLSVMSTDTIITLNRTEGNLHIQV